MYWNEVYCLQIEFPQANNFMLFDAFGTTAKRLMWHQHNTMKTIDLSTLVLCFDIAVFSRPHTVISLSTQQPMLKLRITR